MRFVRFAKLIVLVLPGYIKARISGTVLRFRIVCEVLWIVSECPSMTAQILEGGKHGKG